MDRIRTWNGLKTVTRGFVTLPVHFLSLPRMSKAKIEAADGTVA